MALCSLRKSVGGNGINQYVAFWKTVHLVIEHSNEFRFEQHVPKTYPNRKVEFNITVWKPRKRARMGVPSIFTRRNEKSTL